MSLPSEQNKQKSLSISQLVQHNAQALGTKEQIPYQPTVYALPAEWREMENRLLAEAVQFQPTLYRQISELTTRQEFTEMQEAQKMQIYQVLGSHVSQVERLIRLDGNTREKYSSDLSRKLSEGLRDLSNAKERMEQTFRKWILIAAAVSAVSSILASVLCILLAV